MPDVMKNGGNASIYFCRWCGVEIRQPAGASGPPRFACKATHEKLIGEFVSDMSAYDLSFSENDPDDGPHAHWELWGEMLKPTTDPEGCVKVVDADYYEQRTEKKPLTAP